MSYFNHVTDDSQKKYQRELARSTKITKWPSYIRNEGLIYNSLCIVYLFIKLKGPGSDAILNEMTSQLLFHARWTAKPTDFGRKPECQWLNIIGMKLMWLPEIEFVKNLSDHISNLRNEKMVASTIQYKPIYTNVYFTCPSFFSIIFLV